MTPLSFRLNSFLRKVSLLSFSLLICGLGLSVQTAEAQPWGGGGWCPPTGCEGSMNVSGPFGACPGNLVTCPVSGQGCMMGQSGSCCSNSSTPELYSFVCESSGGGGGGGTTCSTVPLNLSASCNSAGTQATVNFGTPSGWAPRYDLRVDADPTSWTNTCASVNPGDVCTSVNTSSYTLNTIPGHTYAIWAHPWTECGGSWVGADSTIAPSLTLTCSPPPPPAPTVSLTVSQTTNPGNTAGNGGSITIPSNQTATLSWQSTNAVSCTATGNWAGAKGTIDGQIYTEATGPLAGGLVYTYNLRCTNSAGVFRDNSVRVLVNLPPLGVPAITHVCNPGNTVTLNYGVPTATSYYLRIDETEPSWVPCVAPDQCLDNYPIPSYTRAITPGVRYGSWVYAFRASDGDRKDSAYYVFQCGVPTLTVGVTATPASGIAPLNSVITASVGGTATGTINYHFYCDGVNLTRSYLAQPTTTLQHTCSYPNALTYSPRVRVERGSALPATGSAIVSVSAAPLATVDLKANNAADSLTIRNDLPVVLTWSTSNVVPGSCSASNAWNGAKADNNATGENRGNLATGVHTFTLTCRENISNLLRSDTVSVTSIVPPCVCNNDTGVCKGESYTGSGSCTPNTCTGTKDCRRFWREVAP